MNEREGKKEKKKKREKKKEKPRQFLLPPSFSLVRSRKERNSSVQEPLAKRNEALYFVRTETIKASTASNALSRCDRCRGSRGGRGSTISHRAESNRVESSRAESSRIETSRAESNRVDSVSELPRSSHFSAREGSINEDGRNGRKERGRKGRRSN